MKKIDFSLKTKRIVSVIFLLILLFLIFLKPTKITLDFVIFLPILIAYIIILFFVKEEKQKRYENTLNKIIMFYLILSLIFILLEIFIAFSY